MGLLGFGVWLIFILSDQQIHGINGSSPPHIIFILADDMGWNDVSYHGSDQIPTPNIDSLAYNGVILNRHYVQPLCTPSRASLMTGKYSIRTGMHWAIYPSEKNGLPVTEKLLPEYLKDLGYSTHIVGKWHLGFYKEELTPLKRGFDSHFGFWTGALSYYDHINEDLLQTGPNIPIFSGHDMRRNYSSAWDVVGQYATDLFTQEAVRVIDNHPPDKPLFLYMSHLAVHAGNLGKFLEAPQDEINQFSYISNPNRRTYAAMVSKLDKSIGEVLQALGKNDMLKNSVIVFTSDNGAPNLGNFINWGSNYPFRGDKGSFWEGALRVPAVVWSPLIAKASRVSPSLIHITDWLPTLLSVAGYDTASLNIDGTDQWQTITNGYPSYRTNVLIDSYEHDHMNGLTIGSFKYIKGASLVPPFYEKGGFLNIDTIFSKNAPKYDINKIVSSPTWMAVQNVTNNQDIKRKILKIREEATVKCEDWEDSIISCDEVPCLFDIMTDPCELKNIAEDFPILTKYMETILQHYKSEMLPKEPLFLDPLSNPDLYNDTWSIWVS